MYLLNLYNKLNEFTDIYIFICLTEQKQNISVSPKK